MLPEQAHIAWARLQEDLALAATLGVKQLPIDHIRKRMNDLEADLPLQTSFISEGKKPSIPSFEEIQQEVLVDTTAANTAAQTDVRCSAIVNSTSG